MRALLHATLPRLLLAAFAVVALAAAALFTSAVAAPPELTPSASAHGWITSPPSRQDHCAKHTVTWSCDGVEYEPQSVESSKGSLLCSGGTRFVTLDDNALAWPRTTVASSQTFTWTLTARHRTSTWEYFVDGQLFKTVNDNGATPGATVTHTLTGLPSGNHTILARWNVYDTNNAFYACVDVNVGGSGNPSPTPTPTPTPTTPPTGSCDYPAWSATTTYVSGDLVAYQGREYRARWWTIAEIPSQSGEWGVWADLGVC
ncbi:lytic polysaccharide monooxygenase [Antribacter sp. KLBMP9083]|uniref:Lytic polysaccharide monooxygenase n=1 Tax=Antribacter soli TaxID=2910976 RepID=A0AA41U7V5_9MICO|nr:lytic polysaccharide monooxygenase [Antribacter soli]MCF4121785.1 lytic polysaccharide monooxygenase [Antribacter soli]